MTLNEKVNEVFKYFGPTSRFANKQMVEHDYFVEFKEWPRIVTLAKLCSSPFVDEKDVKEFETEYLDWKK